MYSSHLAGTFVGMLVGNHGTGEVGVGAVITYVDGRFVGTQYDGMMTAVVPGIVTTSNGGIDVGTAVE
jgi:hypothetical protein